MSIISIVMWIYIVIVLVSVVLIVNKVLETDDFTVGYLILIIAVAMIPPIGLRFIIEEYGVDIFPYKTFNIIKSIFNIKLINKKHVN